MEGTTATPGEPPALTDLVDRHVAEWLRVIPDLDPVTEGLVTRMQWIVHRIKRAQQAGLEGLGISQGEWELLHALRRQGAPWRAASTSLAGDLRLSPSALTNRVDRMERAGLARRVADPDDRRKVLVEPTADGMALYERAMNTQGDLERELVGTLDPAEREALNALLRRLLAATDRFGTDRR
jgi:DNA-binding MarR family transcriptional regulator